MSDLIVLYSVDDAVGGVEVICGNALARGIDNISTLKAVRRVQVRCWRTLQLFDVPASTMQSVCDLFREINHIVSCNDGACSVIPLIEDCFGRWRDGYAA